MSELTGDSYHYELLAKGVELSRDIPGLTCEIGLRLGGGSKYIIDAIAEFSPTKTHIAVDPYGSIVYQHKQDHFVRLDYTNEMRNECLANIYKYIQEKKVNFLFFNMTDTDFFGYFESGVPIYNTYEGEMSNNYSFVFLDGPHAILPLIEEINFFNDRMMPGACMAFDDVTDYYDHDEIEVILFAKGWKLIDKTYHKALYQKG